MANIIKQNEMAILKAVTIKLDDNTRLIATLQYHTERDDAGKIIHAKSRYRWLARVDTVENINKCIAEYKLDENKLKPWRWPNDPSWDGEILYDKSTTLGSAAKWLRLRLKKEVDYDFGIKCLDGWQKTKNAYNVTAAYDTEDYIATDGSTVSLKDKAALLSRVGQNFVKNVVKIVKEPTSQKAAAPAPQPNGNQAPQPTENADSQPETIINETKVA